MALVRQKYRILGNGRESIVGRSENAVGVILLLGQKIYDLCSTIYASRRTELDELFCKQCFDR